MTKQTKFMPLIAIFFTAFFSCKSNDNEMSYYHKVEPFEWIIATFEDGSGNFTPSQSHPYGDTIKIDFPYYFPEGSDQEIDINRMKLSYKLGEQVTMVTVLPGVVDLSKHIIVEVINADRSRQKIVLTGNISKNREAQIKSFTLPGASIVGLIVESEKRIGIDKMEKNLSNLVPEIIISRGATIHPDPSIPQNFNNSIEYTVTAEDGTQSKYTVVDIHTINAFEIQKGINVASWLSTPKYSGERRKAFFTENDVLLLKELGFDHIRLLIDEIQLWDESGAKIFSYGFDLLHSAIQWCNKYGMKVIVDLHITRNHRFTSNENLLFTDPTEPAKFVKLWQDISDELSIYPNSLVAYELLNEPVSQNPDNWNRVLDLAIQAIRALEAVRTIIVGVCTSNNAVMYNDLKIPQNDDHILLTFHFYAPYLLTAYGLESTTGGRTDIPIQYPGRLIPEAYISQLPVNWQTTGQRIYEKSTLEESLLKGINCAIRLKVPAFVGEFGTLKYLPEPSRSNWYRDVVDILNSYGIPYTSFDYKGAGYSVVGEDLFSLYPEIIQILTEK